MMDGSGEYNLLDFYLDTKDETIDEIKESLANMGLDPTEFTDRLKKKLQKIEVEMRKEEARLKLDEGKALQERFNNFFAKCSISDIRDKLKEKIELSSSAQFAFNKLDGLDEKNAKEMMDDELKLMILKELWQID